ncbi:MFS multidrug transporter [Blastomyces gilchristii SLH14081]|uniref:MFS multidrug transporter n=1 Tax=Blastomyces gilchristii (strain SLH14081) TaxID=559298 RepID=A0A179UFX8_BLAGS|nr:MFS multidrug transporter [Blastomyces gilchristii SLH14081]OAT06935.1 MFS multidrug transporter [Blastomyces gilchristii SLH14081]
MMADAERTVGTGEIYVPMETEMVPPNLSNDSLSQSGGGSPIDGTMDYALSAYRFRRVASKTIMSFHSMDPANPFNWSKNEKRFVFAGGMATVLNSTLCSSLPSGAMPYIAKEFNITSQEQLVLPISLFLVGYVFGPIVCGPMSESYGRKTVMVIPFFFFMVFTLGCALCQNWASLLVFRLILGAAASAPLAIVGGLFADIHNDPRERGQVMAYFMAVTTVGPLVGPWLSGFTAPISWRWPFWIALMIAGVSAPLCFFMPETYAPILLKRRARALRKSTGNPHIVAPLDIQKQGIKVILTVTLTRPLRMMFQESIVLFTCLYLAIVYAIFFIYFQAYPVIFQGIYGMSTGVSGLMYLPIALGAVLSCAVFNWWDSYLYKAKFRGKSWANIEEYRRLPLACIGGPLYVIALFWLGWTATPNIHWAVPMLSGIPFGAGYLLIFMAMLNYLVDAYETFSASAQSAASCCRSIFAVCLPISTTPMFNRLSVSWACSMLGFFSLAMSFIPFAFIRYGEHIRRNSKFCQYLHEQKEAERIAEQEEDRMHHRTGVGRDVEKARAIAAPIP